MTTQNKAITVYLRPEILEALKARAAADGRSLNNLVSRHLEQWVSADALPAPRGYHRGGVEIPAETQVDIEELAPPKRRRSSARKHR